MIKVNQAKFKDEIMYLFEINETKAYQHTPLPDITVRVCQRWCFQRFTVPQEMDPPWCVSPQPGARPSCSARAP
jgi:hypothetical protein